MTKSVLEEVFGEESETKVEGLMPNSPSNLSREAASQAIQMINLNTALRDIGVIMAREISMELERMSMRAADYLDLPNLPEMVAERLGKEISKAPDQFVQALMEYMALRG